MLIWNFHGIGIPFTSSWIPNLMMNIKIFWLTLEADQNFMFAIVIKI